MSTSAWIHFFSNNQAHITTMKKTKKENQNHKKAKTTSKIIAEAIAKAAVRCRGDACIRLVCDVKSNNSESDATK